MNEDKKTFWDRLSSSEKSYIEHSFGEVHRARKSIIFKEGSLVQCVYILTSGIIKHSITGASGHECITHISSRGDIIAAESLFTGTVAGDTATTLTDVEMISIPRVDFFTLLKIHPHIEREIINNLTLLLQKNTRRMYDLSYHSTEARISASLMDFAQVYGYKPTSNIIAHPIYRKDLASYAGVTVESAIRTLSKMRKNGIISIENKYVGIKDIKELTRISRDE